MNINTETFNEAEWLQVVFLLADTQAWLDGILKNAFIQLPLPDKKKLMRKTYYLTVTALAHILERHYYKISRHALAGKFHIPVIELLQHIRDAGQLEPVPMTGTLNFLRVIHTPSIVGYNKNGQAAKSITILTDAGGKIITAFPGEFE